LYRSQSTQSGTQTTLCHSKEKGIFKAIPCPDEHPLGFVRQGITKTRHSSHDDCNVIRWGITQKKRPMLHEFLLAEPDEILALCSNKILCLADSRSSRDEMERGLTVFYDELIEVLRTDTDESGEARNNTIESVHRDSAERRGKESLKLGYSISQVVHGYGALCQAITEYIESNSSQTASPREFNRLNFCLDIAIAEAVTEFNRGQCENALQDEVQRLGFLAHELRNALTSASLAYHRSGKGIIW
jgi:hypothetical protein